MKCRVADDVVWEVARHHDQVHALLAPDGELLVLRQVSALIWLAVVDGLDPVEIVIQETGGQRDEVESSTRALLDDLIVRGLVEECA